MSLSKEIQPDNLGAPPSDVGHDNKMGWMDVPGYGSQVIYHLNQEQGIMKNYPVIPTIAPMDTYYAEIDASAPLDGGFEDIPILTLTNKRHLAMSKFYMFHRQNFVIKLDIRLPIGALGKYKLVYLPVQSKTKRSLEVLVNAEGVIFDTDVSPCIFVKIMWSDPRFMVPNDTSIQLGNLYIIPIMQMAMSTSPEPFRYVVTRIPVDMDFFIHKPLDITSPLPIQTLPPVVVSIKKRKLEEEYSGELRELSPFWSFIVTGIKLGVEVFFPGIGPTLNSLIDIIIPLFTSESVQSYALQKGPLEFKDYLKIPAGSVLRIVEEQGYFAVIIFDDKSNKQGPFILSDGDITDPSPIPWQEPEKAPDNPISINSQSEIQSDSLPFHRMWQPIFKDLSLYNVFNITETILDWEIKKLYYRLGSNRLSVIGLSGKYMMLNRDSLITEGEKDFNIWSTENPDDYYMAAYAYHKAGKGRQLAIASWSLGYFDKLREGTIQAPTSMIQCPPDVDFIPFIRRTTHVSRDGKVDDALYLSFVLATPNVLQHLSKDTSKPHNIPYDTLTDFMAMITYEPTTGKPVLWSILLSIIGEEPPYKNIPVYIPPLMCFTNENNDNDLILTSGFITNGNKFDKSLYPLVKYPITKDNISYPGYDRKQATFLQNNSL